MSTAFEVYNQTVELIGALRRNRVSEEEEIRPLLEQLEELFPLLSASEQEIANRSGWRGWPALQDERRA